MNNQLSYRDLEGAGTDAAAVWTARHDEVERAAAMAEAAGDAVNLPGLKRQLTRLEWMHAKFFGEQAA